MDTKSIRKNIAVLALCSSLVFCEVKQPSEGINMKLINKEPVKEEKPAIEDRRSEILGARPTVIAKEQGKEQGKKFEVFFKEEEALKYINMDALKGNAAVQKKARLFISKLMDSETLGLLFLNEFLISHIDDDKRATAAVAILLRMYNKKPHLAASIESILVENVTSDDPAKFWAGASLLYHLIRKFPSERHRLHNPYEVDQVSVLQKMIDHLQVTKNSEIKILGAQFFGSLSELLGVPIK